MMLRLLLFFVSIIVEYQSNNLGKYFYGKSKIMLLSYGSARPKLMQFILVSGNKPEANFSKHYEFEEFGNGELTCSEDSIYTRRLDTKCDGWGKTSLEECMQKCKNNEIPIYCTINDDVCEYVIWSQNKDRPPGYCQLANHNCKTTKSNYNDITLLKLIGKII